MYLSHKIRIYPNRKSRQYLAKCFGTARFAYNWAIATSKRHYGDTGKLLSAYDLKKQLNSAKKTEYPWMYEVTKHAPTNAILNSGKAFKRFFKKKAGFPRFHKKGIGDSFTITADDHNLRPADTHFRIPKLKSSIRMAETVRFPGRVLSVTITNKADRYFASFHVELPDTYPYPYCSENQTVVGVDLGIKDFAVLSTGEKIPGPKALRSNERKLKRLQRSLSRKKKGSQNRRKARLRVARQHLRIRDIRQDFLHKLSTFLVSQFGTIVIEDLAVSNMMKNHHLAKSISDQGWGEFRRQLDYKTKLANQKLIISDRFYPSSKLCSVCGQKNDRLQLKDREWTCSSCGTINDRDVNAAINLQRLAGSSLERINACGGSQDPVRQEGSSK